MELCAKRKGGISHTKHLDLACLILRRVIKIRDQLPMLTIGFTVQSSINTSSKRNSYSRCSSSCEEYGNRHFFIVANLQ